MTSPRVLWNLKNQDLITEVTSQYSSHFTPNIGNIKKAIKTPIEKENIEPDRGDRGMGTPMAHTTVHLYYPM
jgi:hypothetical protein